MCSHPSPLDTSRGPSRKAERSRQRPQSPPTHSQPSARAARAGASSAPRGPGRGPQPHLEVDLVHHFVVRFELVKLHLEIGRRENVGEDHGVEVHGFLVPPQRQHVALLARSRRLGGSALQLLLGRRQRAGLVLGRLLPLAVTGADGGAVVGHSGGARSGAAARGLRGERTAAPQQSAGCRVGRCLRQLLTRWRPQRK